MKRRFLLQFLALPLALALAWAQPPASAAPAGRKATAQTSQGQAERSKRRPAPRAPVGDLWAQTQLYFGTGKPDGSEVTDEEFQHFLEDVVTPRFPDGLTLLTGLGQYRNSAGAIVKERSKLLILLYPKRNAATNARIEEIREMYKAAFQQESVLRVDTKGRVSF
jgi:hypothetical protein